MYQWFENSVLSEIATVTSLVFFISSTTRLFWSSDFAVDHKENPRNATVTASLISLFQSNEDLQSLHFPGDISADSTPTPFIV